MGNQSDRALLLLVALPLAVCLLAGVACLLVGASKSGRDRAARPGAVQMPMHPIRAVWCIALYAVPSAAIVATYFYEYAR